MSKSAKGKTGRIAERLAGRHVLVTGATGLLGKVFVEKMLRSVPQIGKITLLVRGRADGLSAEERVTSEILESSVFERLGALLGPRFPKLWQDKIGVVSGDLTRDHLGLADDEYTALARDVDLIVNSAAAVTFDERLDIALSLNALGPTRLLELARDAGNIPFMQVSTCYVSGRRSGEIREDLAGGDGIDIDGAISRMEEICRRIKDEPGINGEAVRRKLIDAGMELARGYGWNDTYTFTKWLGEQLVVREHGKVPLVLLRPAIIEGSYEEPAPGWIDGLRMADPMIMAFGRGKLGEFPAKPNIPIDIIPVDHVANAMIAALPSPEGSLGVRVYQVASSLTNPVMIADLARCLGESFRRRPMLDDAGRPIDAGEFRLVKRESFERKWRRKAARLEKFRASLAFFGLAPERRLKIGTVLAQIEQVLYFASIYLPYTHLDCRFADRNLRALAESLHPDDRAEFAFDVAQIDWPDYLINRHIPGLRKFVLGGAKSAEPHAVRVDDRAIRTARDQSRTIFEVFERVARICPTKIMLQMSRGGRWIRYTYAEALAATVAVVRRFLQLDLQPGDRVALCAASCPEWGVLYLAAQRYGLTAVPLDPQLPPEDIVACARFAKAKVIFGDRNICEAISESSTGTGAGAPPPVIETAQDAARLASILFTSGTTVSPKAVPLTHTNLLANARALLEVHPLKSTDSFVSVLPLYHALEFTAGLLVPICIGGTVSYVEQLKAPEVLATMQTVRPTLMLAVPRLLKLFHDAIQRRVRESSLPTRAMFRTFGALANLSGGRLARTLFGRVHSQFGGRLRMFISGGSALDPELYAGFTQMGFEVYEGYGLTETSPVLTVNPPGRGKSGSTGPSLPGVDLEIRNANSEGIGELWARGPIVMSGYLDNAEATADVMRDGWFRTGDLCRRDGDGYYYITGRVKDMIVTEAGKNVYPDEVEARYNHLPYVKEMCVVGVTVAGGIGESVHAVVVPDYEAHAELDTSAIERTIREEASAVGANIPTHQRIQSIHFWSVDLPKTSTLKAKRGVIRDMLSDGGPEHRAPAAPAPAKGSKRRAAKSDGLSKGQLYVRKVLAELTREPEAAIHADSNLLLDLGVDSLMKLQLIGELESHFDVKCTNETAAALARVSDVFALIGEQSPRRGPAHAGKTWSERQLELGAAPETDPAMEDSTGVPPGLLPVRWAVSGGLRLFFNTYIRVRARGREHIPDVGPFLVTPNHSSHLDAAAVLTALAGRRRVWTAGAEDYFFNTALKRWVFGHLLDTIPFDRHSEGFEGVRRCLEKLEQGDGVLFFPEGTRSLTGLMADFKIGGALMAIEAGVPVIPTRIDNAFELLPKGRSVARPGVIRVTFGAPIDPGNWRCADDLNRQAQLCREFSRHLGDQVLALSQGPMIRVEEPE
jgi:long-chain acyl-CoA synthetase